jgi:hypothetical protein
VYGSTFKEINQIEFDDYDQLSITRSMINNQLVEVTLMTNVTFSQGDILGIRLQQQPVERGSPFENNLAVLKQSEVHGRTQVCYVYYDQTAADFEYVWCTRSDNVEKLYIAIETGET